MSDDKGDEKILDNQLVKECYEYILVIAKTIYENEDRRYNSVILQASQMQTAFSFVIVALFMLIPVVENHSLGFSFRFWAIVFSSTAFVLLLSLFAATMAQNRCKRLDFPLISDVRRKVEREYMNFSSSEQRNKYLVETYEKIQCSYSAVNDSRTKWVRASMYLFIAALGLCAFWFIVILFKRI